MDISMCGYQTWPSRGYIHGYFLFILIRMTDITMQKQRFGDMFEDMFTQPDGEDEPEVQVAKSGKSQLRLY